MTQPAGRPARWSLWLGIALVIAGCSGAPASGAPTVTPPEAPSATQASPPLPSPTAPALPSAGPSPTTASASPPSAETHPPGATLLDAGGRGVVGQVGTFAWQGVVSDSPLLPGAPVTVRTGQRLTISVVGPRPTHWAATLFSNPGDPASGRGYGQGVGVFSLVAPDRPGAWTLRLKIVYGVGEVTHYWRLTVTE